MKIIHVFHSYWPAVGGLENVIRLLAEGMAKLGHEVHVVTGVYGAENKPKENVVNNVYIHRVETFRPKFPDLTYPLEYPVDVLKNADVIHGHSQNSLFTVMMVEKAKKLGVKTVMHFMSVDAFSDHPNPLVRLLAPHYGKWILQKAFRISDIKLVRSRRDEEILKRKYSIDAIYVPDGVSDELLRKPSMTENFIQKYAIYEPFVVYVGRLHRLKGVDIFIKAMSFVVKEVPELKAVIIGPGDQRPYRVLAQKLGVERNIVFLGFVDEDTKIGAVDASLALVLPSICDYVEVYPMVISEAWARTKPVIASSVGGVPYRVKHGVNGLLVPPRDSYALAKAIVEIYNDRNFAEKLGREGKKEIHSWSEIVDKLINIYKNFP